MVKKKVDENNDLTRIEDLSEFLHQEDSDLDSVFDNFSPSSPEEDSTLFELPNEEIAIDDSSVIEEELADLGTLEELEDLPMTELSFDENDVESESDLFEALPDVDHNEIKVEETEAYQATDDIEEVDLDADDSFSYDEPPPIAQEVYTNTSEKFEDVKTFAQNFSYGKVSMGGGNPPYTIIARHIKFQDDADDILNLLEEFGIVNDTNEKDTKKAMEFGSLIIPQISEYTAIVLAHKLRRYDLDLEVGLSDEVHPSKSGDTNPRGLLKKDNLKQNRTESLKIEGKDISIQDIIVSTSASIPGHYVLNYIGVQTTFAIVEESELEKLQYVGKAQRQQSELYDYNASDLTTEKAFKDYQNSFALLYEDLSMQLKQKAFAQNANALLGLNFQLSPLQFERSHARVNAYQITCSATLAVVGLEKN